MKDRGLGDTLQRIIKATTMDKVAKFASEKLGKDCGCEKRKDILNKMVPYNKSK